MRHGLEASTPLFRLIGAIVSPLAKPLENAEAGRINWNTAAHIIGTCAMGDNLPDSVVDRWRKAHDCSNLWIAGSSMFLTSAISNPTLTIAALALRPAAAIDREMSHDG